MSSSNEVIHNVGLGCLLRNYVTFIGNTHTHTHTLLSNVLLTAHLSVTLVNDQLDAQLLYFIIRLLQSST